VGAGLLPNLHQFSSTRRREVTDATRIKSLLRSAAFQFASPGIARSVNGNSANADAKVLLKTPQVGGCVVSKACDCDGVQRSGISSASRWIRSIPFCNRQRHKAVRVPDADRNRKALSFPEGDVDAREGVNGHLVLSNSRLGWPG
jgi:hypothetical protein